MPASSASETFLGTGTVRTLGAHQLAQQETHDPSAFISPTVCCPVLTIPLESSLRSLRSKSPYHRARATMPQLSFSVVARPRVFLPARRPPRRHVVCSRPLAQQQAATRPAAASVERGLQLFQEGKYEDSLPLFLRAMSQQPNEDEARAALYNAACAHAKLGQWQQAAESVVEAINKYELKLAVALKDPDLEALRERREWITALNEVKGGVTEQQYRKLRSEAKAPFRLTRMFIFGALAAGAGLGLFIITTRLIAALQGNGDLQEALTNFTINSAALAIFSFLLYRDYSQQQKDEKQVAREEALGKLQVAMGADRVLPLSAFRGFARPVIIAGSKGQIGRALFAAERFKPELRERGICVVPIMLSEDDAQERLRRLKAELSGEPVPAAPLAVEEKGKGFGASPDKKAAAKPPQQQQQQLTNKDKRWQLEAASLGEWVKWLDEQKRNAKVEGDNSIYVQVQLDGTVRASGVGLPPWTAFIKDLPELSSVRTKFTDGAGI